MSPENGQAFIATYSDLRIVKGRKMVQIILEVAQENAEEALAVLGGLPRPDLPVWVGVARIDKTASQEAPQKERRAFHELRPSAQAGILCDDPVFQEWMRQRQLHNNVPWAEGENRAEVTADMLRNDLGIASRRQLDTDGAYAEMFQNLYAQFRKASGRETWTP
jgi:hypothetical protein